jgi:2-polyprenyl-6-methoxyphenol hydroxylase-like FAD-dependent oxidoreductase
MSPVGAIGVNVAVATAAVAAQVLYPCLGRGPITHAALQAVQRLREEDVRTLHGLQLRGQQLLVGRGSQSRFVKWLTPKALWLLLRSPIMPRFQRRVFFGAPLPPLDPAFGFHEPAGEPPNAAAKAAAGAATGQDVKRARGAGA